MNFMAKLVLGSVSKENTTRHILAATNCFDTIISLAVLRPAIFEDTVHNIPPLPH